MTVTTAGSRLLRANPDTESSRLAASSVPRTLAQKLSRCASVSLITTVISLGTLAVATAGFGIAAWVANVIAVCVATFPSYTLNRRWTWGVTGASDFRRQVLPFWVLAFVGLLLSTLAVGLTEASGLAGAMPTPLLATGAVLAAHLSGWAVLWVVQFFVLDRVPFAAR
jgi:putative flippase GtrA